MDERTEGAGAIGGIERSSRHLALSHPDEQPQEAPAVTVSNEICDAIADLSRDADGYFHLPWSALDHVVGGMPPGEVCYVGAFSGHGKTTLLTSLLNDTFEQTNARVYYMGLESRPRAVSGRSSVGRSS